MPNEGPSETGHAKMSSNGSPVEEKDMLGPCWGHVGAMFCWGHAGATVCWGHVGPHYVGDMLGPRFVGDMLGPHLVGDMFRLRSTHKK